MAIFAGGFLIKRMVKHAFSLKSDDGIQIFVLETDTNVKAFRNHFKSILNETIKVTEEQVQLLMEESTQVLTRNNLLVATVQTTRAFENAERFCAGTLAAILSVLAVLAAIYAHR